MKYKAIKSIGGYNVGDEVPSEKAEVWLEMYSVPHVELVDREAGVVEQEAEGPKVEPESNEDVMFEDYLARNSGVVRKNIKDDQLSKHQLEKLLKLEKSSKDRYAVIMAIEKKIKMLN